MQRKFPAVKRTFLPLYETKNKKYSKHKTADEEVSLLVSIYNLTGRRRHTTGKCPKDNAVPSQTCRSYQKKKKKKKQNCNLRSRLWPLMIVRRKPTLDAVYQHATSCVSRIRYIYIYCCFFFFFTASNYFPSFIFTTRALERLCSVCKLTNQSNNAR